MQLLPFLTLISLLPSALSRNPLGKRSEAGPVLPENFPDPCIINVKGSWYAFATRSVTDNVNIPIATAQWDDFENEWELVMNGGVPRDALPVVPAWVNMTSPNTWAPDVNQLDDGTFIMYFSATTTADPSGGIHCVGAAKSTSILGPYTATSSTPLFCPLSQGGAIDPAGFKDWNIRGRGWGPQQPPTALSPAAAAAAALQNSWTGSPEWCQGGKGGKRYVTYKVDGASIGHGGICNNGIAPIIPTPIILQQVAADGVTPIGANYTLLDNLGLADDGVTEAPSLVKTWNGTYVLFFSNGCYSSPDYTVNYAVSTKGVTGPYVRYGPLFKTGDYGLSGPGGADILWDGSHMVFHANNVTDFTGVRLMHTAVVGISGVHVSA